MDFEDTIVAVATPYGESALAVIRLSGSMVNEIAKAVFSKLLKPRKATMASYRDVANDQLDDVVATYFENPASYTGEDLLEISCHGSLFIVRRIVDDCLARGCRAAEPGEFTQRSFRNGKMDLSQAEAVIDLIHARSEAARKVALRQVNGQVSRKVSELTDALLLALAQLEAYIDFPEEDLPPEDPQGPIQQILTLEKTLRDLAATSQYRSMFSEGIKTVFVGAPNAGKSSLLNAFIGEDRALVSEIAGTTRDYIREQFNLGPFTIQILDTAGIREEATDKIERMGIERSIAQVEEADCVLWVIDGENPDLELPEAVLAKMRSVFTYALINKQDSGSAAFPVEGVEGFRQFKISATSDLGVDAFKDEWLSDLKERLPDLQSETVIVGARHEESLSKAAGHLKLAVGKLLNDDPVELAVSDVRESMEALGKIVGKIDNERMLDQLFSHFCIGK